MTGKQSSPTIVITGASAGIGEETALLFAEKGWRVVIAARRLDRLDDLAQRLAAKKASEVVVLKLDVTDDKSVKEFAAKTLEATHGQVDISTHQVECANTDVGLGTWVTDLGWLDMQLKEERKGGYECSQQPGRHLALGSHRQMVRFLR